MNAQMHLQMRLQMHPQNHPQGDPQMNPQMYPQSQPKRSPCTDSVQGICTDSVQGIFTDSVPEICTHPFLQTSLLQFALYGFRTKPQPKKWTPLCYLLNFGPCRCTESVQDNLDLNDFRKLTSRPNDLGIPQNRRQAPSPTPRKMAAKPPPKEP